LHITAGSVAKSVSTSATSLYSLRADRERRGQHAVEVRTDAFARIGVRELLHGADDARHARRAVEHAFERARDLLLHELQVGPCDRRVEFGVHRVRPPFAGR